MNKKVDISSPIKNFFSVAILKYDLKLGVTFSNCFGVSVSEQLGEGRSSMLN